MQKIHFLILIFLSLILTACTRGQRVGTGQASEGSLSKKFHVNHCFQKERDNFDQDQRGILYGKECFQETTLFVKAGQKGSLVSTSQVINKEGHEGGGLRLQKVDSKGKLKEVNFIPGLINKVYATKYKILKGKGHYNTVPFLKEFLSENERFLVNSLGSKYQIVFKLVGDYLVLFKASKNLDDLPYIERTSVVKSEDDRLHMVPFVGYPVYYCSSEHVRDSSKVICEDQDKTITRDTAEYIKISKNLKRVYNYREKAKKDLFPKSYFTKGRWFYTSVAIETPDREEQMPVSKAFLVELIPRPKTLQLKNMSAAVEDHDRDPGMALPVHWVDYEMDKEEDNFNAFGERKEPFTVDTQTFHLQIDFPSWTPAIPAPKGLKFGDFKKIQIIDLVVTEDYFSFVAEVPISNNKPIKIKTSFMREETLDQRGFSPKKWFSHDFEHRFGIMFTGPKNPENTKREDMDHYRMIHFNTGQQNTLIKWYLSKNTPRNKEGKYYREIAKEAVAIYNRAFEIITEDSGKTVKLELAEREEEDKDMGDPRYNIINIITKNLSFNLDPGSLYGMAPSYTYSETGQIIGVTANVVTQNIFSHAEHKIRNYIRYEIFQKDREFEEGSKPYPVSPYNKAQIERLCDKEEKSERNIRKFIQAKKALKKKGELKPRDFLNDKNILTSCGQKIAREGILFALIHEMGRSFGLSHNFRASTDLPNYYKSIEEMEKHFPGASKNLFAKNEEEFKQFQPKLSSVMDYPSLDMPMLPVLGKYDLAALRYLYMDQVEKTDYSYVDSGKNGKNHLISLNTAKNPSQQQKLGEEIISLMKPYAHCSDNVRTKNTMKGGVTGVIFRQSVYHSLDGVLDPSSEDFLCISEDYGSTPLEIVNNDIAAFNRTVKNLYRYDGEKPPKIPLTPLKRILSFYDKWTLLKNDYLSTTGQEEKAWTILNDKKTINSYLNALEGTDSNEEYALYKPIRDVITNFLMDFLFSETMKCRAKNERGDEFLLDLEAIKKTLSTLIKGKRYVVDCYSGQIRKWLKKNNLELVSQKGLENFISYSQGKNADKPDLLNLENIKTKVIKDIMKANNSIIKANNSWNMSLNPTTRRPHSDHLHIANFLQEPDFAQKFFNRIIKIIMNNNKLDPASPTDLFNAMANYGNFFLEGLKVFPTNGNPQKYLEVFSDNYEMLASATYFTGTGSRSFYKKIVEPIRNNDENPDIIKVPFIYETYLAYRDNKTTIIEKNPEHSSLQTYLIGLENTIDQRKNFIVPYKSGSLADKFIKKYNDNLKQIESVENQIKTLKSQDLSFDLLEIEKDTLVSHAFVLMNVINAVQVSDNIFIRGGN